MLRKLFSYPTTYLILLIVLYSIYDYVEHITRSGSIFEEHPWNWLLFNIAVILSFIITVLFTKKMLEKIVDKKNLGFEVIGIGIWLFLYLSILGSILNKLFWPFNDLYFQFKMGPFFIFLIIFFIVRILLNLVLGKKAMYSK